MALRERTDPFVVCLDADVIIAGLFSTTGASHAVLVLAEIGLLRTVVPEAVASEVRRNLNDKLPGALPAFDSLLKAAFVTVYRPAAADLRSAKPLSHSKDAPVMAAALGSGSTVLVTHNTRHFKSTATVQVMRPRELVEQVRAWMAKFNP